VGSLQVYQTLPIDAGSILAAKLAVHLHRLLLAFNAAYFRQAAVAIAIVVAVSY
jgi:hypothetical protein